MLKYVSPFFKPSGTHLLDEKMGGSSTLQKTAEKVCEKSIGLNLQEREFLEQHLNSSTSLVSSFSRATDVLAYCYLRGDETLAARTVQNVHLGMLRVGFLASVVATSIGGLACDMTIPVGGYVVGGLGISVLGFTCFTILTSSNLLRRGREMIAKYNRWRDSDPQ